MIITEGGIAQCVVTEYYQIETEAVVVIAFHQFATGAAVAENATM
ncbi:MAG: hypothetical protein PHE79_04530 [Eubacteriales bacterium]|nr:hypothetical protein [Eubacteriales bacterium]